MNDSRPQPPNIFFRLIIPAAAAFIVTVLAMVATVFGDPEAPINGLLDRYGGYLVTVEVMIILVLLLLALGIDRREILSGKGSNRDRSRDETATRE